MQIRIIMRTLKKLGLPRKSLSRFLPPGDALVRDYNELDSLTVVKALTEIWSRELETIDDVSG